MVPRKTSILIPGAESDDLTFQELFWIITFNALQIPD